MIAGEAQQISYKVLKITSLTHAQARRHWIIKHHVKYARIRKMAAEYLLMYGLATIERILARVMRAAFNQSFWRGQGNNLIKKDIRSPIRPLDGPAARKVLLWMTAASAMTTLKAGKLKLLGAQETDGMVKFTGSRVGQAQLARLLGTGHLPMVMQSKILALHITEDAHAEDHRLMVRNVTTRAR